MNFKPISLVVLILIPAGCVQSRHSTGTSRIAEALVAAFNAHDPASMASFVSPDFELYYVDENGEAALALRGREELIQEMEGYFVAQPEVQSKIVDVVHGTTYIAFREQIVGGQSSLAVYEIREKLIRRVWYYPAE